MTIKGILKRFYTHLTYPKSFILQLIRNFLICLILPSDFIFTFGDSLEKIAELKDVNIDAHNTGKKLLSQIQSHITGGMKIYFAGSNFFKISGISDDIDFLVEYTNKEEKEKWKSILSNYFGKPIIENNKFTKWKSIYNNFPVEVMLSTTKFPFYNRLLKSYRTLSTNPALLADYEILKKNSVGVTQREYCRRQIFFFQYICKI